MKRLKLPLWGVLAFCLLAMSTVFVPLSATEATPGYYEVNIATSPASGFLTASNMAPGDQVTSVLAVQNLGNLDLNTSVSARQQAGSTEMYNRLQVMVTDGQGILFEGDLADLHDFDIGTIVVSDSKNITFTAELPLGAGNEFQGLETTVAFDFVAVGHEEEVPVCDGCFEPPFSNRDFTLHQKSTVPIKFHIQGDAAPRSTVRLEVTGPGVNGGTVNYVFRASDGTLKFDQKVQEPHYLARFSTFDDPVVTDGLYTASVYDGDKLLCQKQFTVLQQGNRSNAP